MLGLDLTRAGRTSALLLLSSLAASLTACGVRSSLTDELIQAAAPVTDAGPIAPAADAGPEDAGPGAIDSGVRDAASTDADESPDVALPPADLGDIVLTSGVYLSGTVPTLQASARFYPSVTATGCSISPVSGCTLETCPHVDAGAYPLVSAGVLSVNGGLYPLVLEGEASGEYGAPAVDGGALNLWRGGERLTVSAGGSAVPAFVDSVIAPAQVTVEIPMLQAVARGAPPTFAWLGSSPGKLTVDVSETYGSTDYYLECQYDVASGSATLPGAAVSLLPPGSAALTVSTVSRHDAYVGSWRVEMFAQTNANDPSGAEYTGIVAIQ